MIWLRRSEAEAATTQHSVSQERKRGARRRSETVLFHALNVTTSIMASSAGHIVREIERLQALGEVWLQD